ncbi:integrase, catalytic region, zinc finger, CCHC-type containing protein [Tanacetum coccineum]
MSPENKAHYESEKEEIHLLLTGIGDEIYSTVDACKTAYEIWIAIERLKLGESLNIQDVKTNLFWEFGKFTSHDGESMASNASTKFKGKEIAKPITPSSESDFKEDNDPKQAQRDKDMQKNLTLKEVLRIGRKEVITKRTNDCCWARETVGSQVVQQTRIQCFNCKEFGHFAKEFRKPKRQADWLVNTDEEIYKQELEAHYNYMAKIQEVPTADSGADTEPLEQIDSNVIPDSPNMRDNDIQTGQNAKDERVALANLIVNLTLDTKENKKILKQLNKANASLTQELKECKSNLEESNITRDSYLIALQTK